MFNKIPRQRITAQESNPVTAIREHAVQIHSTLRQGTAENVKTLASSWASCHEPQLGLRVWILRLS